MIKLLTIIILALTNNLVYGQTPSPSASASISPSPSASASISPSPSPSASIYFWYNRFLLRGNRNEW